MQNEYNDDEEENVHYISDQDSTDDKPQIESIIHETSKKFRNESYAVKILLTDHYRDFRAKFFERIRKTDKSIYQSIRKEIRNNLNPYRIFIEKHIDIPKEVQELYSLLKGYYKERNFNNVFFINYFKDLEEAHKKKSKISNMLPKDEIETLNDIERKVTLIKNLRHYLNTTIRDRIQINYEQKKEMFENDYSLMMYEYLVIDEEQFSNMNEKDLDKYISNKRSSYKLRRPLNDFNVFNYLPILCKGYCQKEANMFIDKFHKSINSHVDDTKCPRCMEIRENLIKIESQIKSLYTKTCIFSHNINEIMFHPLMFFSLSVFLPFYKKQFNSKPNKEIEDIVEANTIPKRFHNLRNFEIQNIYNPADVGMKKIYNLLLEYAKKKGIYGNCCYLSEYKTEPCKLVFQPNNYDYYIHMKKCPFFHSKLEKRRINKILGNDICKDAIKDGKWIVNDEEKINCSKGEYCNKYHTRNELFFDERNYRKLYPCTESSYCEKGELCPKKHPTDIKIDEIYLPIENKTELEKDFMRITEKNDRVLKKLQKISKIMCKSCLNFIDGVKDRNIYKFNSCNHIICSKCYEYYKSCPLCGINKEENDDNDDRDNKYNKITYIKIDEINKFKNNNNKEESEDEKEESEKEEKSKNEEESSEEESSDISDSDLDDEYNNNDKSLDSDISISDVIFEEDNTYNEKRERNRPRERDPNISNNTNNYYQNNRSYNENNNNSYYSKGSKRGKRGRGRGWVRGRGGRGRGRGGRGKDNSFNSYNYDNNNNYNNYVYKKNESNSNISEIDDSYSRKGKGHVRGSNRKKSNFDNSERYDNEKESEQNSFSKINYSNYKNEDNEDDKDGNNNQDEVEMSMTKESYSRKGDFRGGRGKVRGKRGGKRGGNFKDYDKKSNNSNDSENSMEKKNEKNIKDEDVDEESI